MWYYGNMFVIGAICVANLNISIVVQIASNRITSYLWTMTLCDWIKYYSLFFLHGRNFAVEWCAILCINKRCNKKKEAHKTCLFISMLWVCMYCTLAGRGWLALIWSKESDGYKMPLGRATISMFILCIECWHQFVKLSYALLFDS